MDTVKSVIVGTAGHIDHGKTALVRALTGIDTDRLEEEKRRGITIDLGFAHLALPAPDGRDQLRLGFVDVPGHEKFVRNMLAGIGGIDLVLLIISADEGIKPQTREHFEICRMLNIERGITVLTKCDLVDADTLEVVKLEVEEFLRGSFLDSSRAPMVAVSAISGTGIDDLRKVLAEVASQASPKNAKAAMRLPIDRVFTMKGFGTVVTGTMLSGSLTKEDDVEILPARRTVRVRGVQVHGSSAERAVAGQRTAVNLAGVEKEDLARGMMLTTQGLLKPTRRFDVSIDLLASAKPLKHNARVHLHLFSSETIAEVALINAKEIKPGTRGFAQLRTSEPLAVAPGDRFIIRQFSPVITIGGGSVIDAAPLSRKGSAETRLQSLQQLAEATPEKAVELRVARRGVQGIELDALAQELGLQRSEVDGLVQSQAKAGKVSVFSGVAISSEALAGARKDFVRELTRFHDTNRLVAGMSKEELREKLGLSSEIFAGLLDSVLASKGAELAGELVRLPGRGVAMKADESESHKQIEQAFATAGLKVPLLKDVLAAIKLDRTRAQQVVTLLLRDRVLVKLGDDLVFHRSALDQMRAELQKLKATSPKLDVARFKDHFGISRKYAIPLLEYLDRERVTRRVGDERLIV